MKIKNLSLISLLLVCFKVFSQSVDLAWSDMQVYDNKMEGFFSYFIGGNDKYLYAFFDNKNRNVNKRKINFVAYDTKSMAKVSDVTVVDRKNSETSKEYRGLYYYKTIVFNDVIYTFWTKESNEKDELFVQSFDAKLKPINKLKKIYELTSGKKSAKKAELFVMANTKNSQSIIIGGELSGEKGQSIKVEYKVLKSDFSFASAGQVTLPVIITGKSNGLTSDYSYGDDGNLHVETSVMIPAEERKSLKKNESHSYTIYSIVDVVKNDIRSYPLKFENKNIFDVGVVTQKGVVKIFGFYCDLLKDPKGVDTHGIFYSEINPSTKELEKLNFTNFTKQQLDALFAGDSEDRKDRAGILSGKKKKKSEEESLGSNYQIEQVKSFDEKYLTIFCSLMYNYTRTVCDQRGNCRTYYYCNKRNVTAFKIDNFGNIVWASNLDRAMTYSGWNIKDLSVVSPDGKKFYVSYGSSYSKDSKRKNSFNKKTGKHMRDYFEYAIFDYNSGQFSKEEYEINPPGTKTNERKFISAADIQIINEKFYLNSERIKIKPGKLIGGCLLSIACPPVGILMLNNPNSKRGTGYLGVMSFGN
ncbi:MAG: hypothetical protein ACK452_06665 [Bacteroidota bacterium]|jgi:hypothetical protein